MRDLLETIEAWQRAGHDVARAIVVRTYGSSPRREGAAMLRADDGRLAGSVSGGCIEGATATRMEEAQASGKQRVVRFGVSDEAAWDVGLACGGTIDVLVQPRIPEAAIEALRATALGRAGARAIVTLLPAGSPGVELGGSELGTAAGITPPLVVHDDGRRAGSLGSDEMDARAGEVALAALERGASTALEMEGRQLFVEVFPLRPRLVIVGAVSVAMALTRLAHDLGYETVVIDGRPIFVTEERFPDADQLVVGWPDEAADEIGLGPADAVAVLSHDPKFDEPAIAEALRRGCRYVGAIGSRRTQRRRLEHLLELGVAPQELERLRGPIGLDLGGREPAETALSILSEIVAARHGASARPLRDPAAGADAG